MSYRDVVVRSWNENLPLSASLELTHACNLDCFYCYNSEDLTGRPLQLAEYRQLLGDLKQLQFLFLVLTGGEPLVHPDFFAIGREARELGFAIRIKSNGYALDRARARRIREELDPFAIDLSIHGARPETHDRQTRVAGSFERLLANVAGMLEEGLRLKLVMTLTRWNEDEVEDVLRLADGLGIAIAVSPTVTPRDDGSLEPRRIAPSALSVGRLGEVMHAHEADRVAARKPPSGPATYARADAPGRSAPLRICGAGSCSLAVDPCGTVYPCLQWRRPLGNLRERSIREIWTESEVLEEVRSLTARAADLVARPGRPATAGRFCPGLAQLFTGDPLVAPDLAPDEPGDGS